MTKRVTQMLQMLPKDITPVNLEELRRVKQNLVELESKADTLRHACFYFLTALGTACVLPGRGAESRPSGSGIWGVVEEVWAFQLVLACQWQCLKVSQLSCVL